MTMMERPSRCRPLSVMSITTLLLLLLMATTVQGSKDKETQQQKFRTASPKPSISPRPTATPTISPMPTLSPAPTPLESEEPTITPTTWSPTAMESEDPTAFPTTWAPTILPTTWAPTFVPTTAFPTTWSPTQTPVVPTIPPTANTVGVPLVELTFTLVQKRRSLRNDEDVVFGNVVQKFLHDYLAHRYPDAYCCFDLDLTTSGARDITVTGDALFYRTALGIPTRAALEQTLLTYLNFFGTKDLQDQAKAAGITKSTPRIQVQGVPVQENSVSSSDKSRSIQDAIQNPFVLVGIGVGALVIAGTCALIVLRARKDAAAMIRTTQPPVAPVEEAEASETEAEKQLLPKQSITADEDDDDDSDEEEMKIPQPAYIRPYGGASSALASVSSRSSKGSKHQQQSEEEEDDETDDDDAVTNDSYTSDGDIVSIASSLHLPREGPLFSPQKDETTGGRWAKSVRK